MANAYCHDGYCEPTGKKSTNTEISNKALIGGYFLFMVALAALIWYGISIGVYIDPAALN
jgi:apolipoprotein N-acyltransferase